MGTTNNVITIRHSDFEVFDALAYDDGVDASDSASDLGKKRI